MFIGSLLMLLWLFRPGSTKTYKKYSSMALVKDDDALADIRKTKDNSTSKE